MSKSFLKWAGGKTRVLPYIRPLLPSAHRLIEPFIGSASVSLALEYDAYLWNDTNADLINVFRTLKQEKHRFIDYVQSFFTTTNNQKNQFYHLREQFNHSTDIIERSALFIYLNRHGYNGLCRYNRKGEFNVPFGRYKSPYFPVNEMNQFIEKSPRIEFMCDDFETVFASIQSRDVVYCDPPYVPKSTTASFTAYSQNEFTWEDHIRLQHIIETNSKKCIAILLSNHDTEQTRKLYSQAQLHFIDIQRNISAKANSRQKTGEILALW